MKDRSLTRFEQALAMTGEYAPFNIVSWMMIEGSVPPKALRTAFQQLVDKSPALRLTLSIEGRHFEPISAFELPFYESKEPYRKLLEQALNHPFEPGMPLWKAIWISKGEEQGLLLSVHHILMDGEAKLRLIHDLLAHLGQGSPLTARTFSPLAQHSSFRQIMRTLKKGIQQEMRYRKRATHSIIAPSPTATRTITLSLSADQTTRLVTLTRKHKTTLNSLLQAALCRAYGSMQPNATWLRGMCFANQRRKLRPKPDATALGAGITLIPYLADSHLGIWDLSHEIQQQNKSILSHGGYFALNWLAPWIIKGGLKAPQHMGDVALSFSGNIESQKDFGTLRLRALQAYISNHHKAPRFSGWGQIQPDGKLNFCFCYHTWTAEEAQQMGGYFMDELKSIT